MEKEMNLYTVITTVVETKQYESEILAESEDAVIEHFEKISGEPYNQVEYVNQKSTLGCGSFTPCSEHDNARIIGKTVTREII